MARVSNRGGAEAGALAGPAKSAMRTPHGQKRSGESEQVHALPTCSCTPRPCYGFSHIDPRHTLFRE